jgi:hypothetical protein
LTDLNENSNHSAPQNAVLHREDLRVLGVALDIVLFLVKTDFVHLDVDLRVVDGETTEVGQVLAASFPFVLACEEARRLWWEDESNEEETSPDELKSDWETPRNGTRVGGGLPVDDWYEEDTCGLSELNWTRIQEASNRVQEASTIAHALPWQNHVIDNWQVANVVRMLTPIAFASEWKLTECDTKLERTGDQPTESGGSCFGLEHGNETRGSADTETSEETTDAELSVLVLRRGLLKSVSAVMINE